METFFSEFAKRGPVLLEDNFFYFLSSQQQTPRMLQFSGSATQFGLIPGGTLEDIASFYRNTERDRFYEIKKRFVEEKAGKPFLDEKGRTAVTNQGRTLSFILKELMPFMSGHKETAYDLLDEVAPENIRAEAPQVDEVELQKTIELVKGTINQEIVAEGREKFNMRDPRLASILNRQLKSKRTLLLRGDAYRLESTNKKKAQLFLQSYQRNQSFNLRRIGQVRAFDETLAEFFIWEAKVQSINELSDYMAEMQRSYVSARKDHEQIMKMKEFRDGDIGFLWREEGLYVFHRIPPFAMLDPRPTKQGICYSFPECRVALKIVHENGNIHLGEPHLVEGFWHPFVHYDKTPFQHLCGGKVPSREGLDTIEWAAKALDDAKNLVMHGLTPKSIRDHNGNQENGGSYFGTPLDKKLEPYKIPFDEAEKRNLLITNKWDWDKN